jgi:hypothetical protein
MTAVGSHLKMAVRVRLLSAMLAIVGLISAASPAFSFDLGRLLGNPDKDAALDTFKLIRVTDLAAAIADRKSGVLIYDVNHPDTRAEYGIIPGAHLLPSAGGYRVSQELPADRQAKLVFYCANTY